MKWTQGARHSGRAGPRLGRRLAGGLGAGPSPISIPLRFGLLFERFLNPERVSMPDFDIDFCQERRDEVIRYVQEKYGRDRVAQIITFGKLQARAAVRDVGRVLQMPLGQVDRIAKLIPNQPGQSGHPARGDRQRAAAAAASPSDEPVAQRLFEIAEQARRPLPPRLDPCRPAW